MDTKPNFDIIDNPQEVVPPTPCGLFTRKSANAWVDVAKDLPKPCHLFDEFWCEGEVCILFSDSNLGKSILAVQIADSISSGKAIDGFVMDAVPQRVLYFDFEMSAKQFEIRVCDDNGNHYHFDDNFERLEMDNIDSMPDDIRFEDYLHQEVESVIEETNARVIIIDNITWLKNGTETAKDALPLMKWIHQLSRTRGLSTLLLAHTPKRLQCNPITQNDLQGSKMLMNFCDSCFAIGGSSQGINTRYLKQIKFRNGSLKYSTDNVAVCEISKTDPDNFVHFRMDRCGFESEHLVKLDDNMKTDIRNQVKELSEKGLSQRDIAQKVGISLGSVNSYLKQ